jgi:hypothetical protein
VEKRNESEKGSFFFFSFFFLFFSRKYNHNKQVPASFFCYSLVLPQTCLIIDISIFICSPLSPFINTPFFHHILFIVLLLFLSIALFLFLFIVLPLVAVVVGEKSERVQFRKSTALRNTLTNLIFYMSQP